MEKMPYQEHADTRSTVAPAQPAPVSNWRNGLPMLLGSQVILRELRFNDAASLLAGISTEEVSSFTSPPPATLEGFEKRAGDAPAVLRGSFLRKGEYLDQVLWSILPESRLEAKAVWGPRIIH